MSQTSVYGSVYIQLPSDLSIEQLEDRFKEFKTQCNLFEKDYGPCPWTIENGETIEAEVETQKGDETPYIKWLQIIVCGFLMPNNIQITDYGLDYETKINDNVVTGDIRIDGNMIKVVTEEYELLYELLKCNTIDDLNNHIPQEYENVSYLKISETKYNEMVNKIKKYEEILKQHNLI